jgi:hypothetical protein
MKVRCKKREFEVYTPHEAADLGIKYRTDWRNAEVGDWILTDDDKVVQITVRRKLIQKYKGKPYKKPTIFISTGYGQIPTSYGKIFARPISQRRRDAPKKNVRATTKQKDFVEDLAITGEIGPSGTFTLESVINSYRATYEDNNDNQALLRGRGILKRKWVKQFMSNKMNEQFEKLDWNDTKVAEEYIAMYGSDDVPASVKKQILDRISHLKGHDIEEKEKETGAEMDFFITAGEKQLMLPLRKILAFWKGWLAEGKPINAEFMDVLQNEVGEDIKQLKPKEEK